MIHHYYEETTNSSGLVLKSLILLAYTRHRTYSSQNEITDVSSIYAGLFFRVIEGTPLYFGYYKNASCLTINRQFIPVILKVRIV